LQSCCNLLVGSPETIERRKTVSAAFDFDAPINSEKRDGYVATEPTAGGTAKRHAFSRKAGVPQLCDDTPLGAGPFVS
jgi:hypothetical protein